MSDELNKQDLFILMESYKNNIQLNTTILEQQKQILILNDQLIEKQKDLCSSVDGLVNKISETTRIMTENHKSLTNLLQDVSDAIKLKVDNAMHDIKLDTVNSHSRLSIEHSGLVNRLYVSMGGMITIIIALIAIIAKVFK